jgi:hypothetical protein
VSKKVHREVRWKVDRKVLWFCAFAQIVLAETRRLLDESMSRAGERKTW